MSSDGANAQASTLRRPEFRLLLGCLRSQNGTLPPELVSPDLDWGWLLQVAQRHSVLPLVHRALGQLSSVPEPVRETMESLFRQSARRSLFLTAELMRLLDGFSEHGISVLPYKGPSLAQSLYGDIALRSFSDLDLLVRIGDVQRATEALETLGYAADAPVPPARRSAHLALASEQMFRRSTSAALVELQWRIVPRYFSVDFDFDWFWRTAVRASLGSRDVPALAPEALLLVLSVHGAKHKWESLVWIADIAQLLHKHPDLDWDSILRSARALGIERLLFLALALAAELLSVQLPGPVAQLVTSDPAIASLCRVVERNLACEVRSVPSFSDHWFSLRGRERWRDRFRYVARLGLTPNPQDWALLPLPPALAPLYFGIRPLRLLSRTMRSAGRRVFGTVAAPASGSSGNAADRS
ncbi:MAG TPA: nucleotidyltransferase family protein [Terriglobales bacterium]|nr:nucleotidyltransferase family protein [Terriglobales bacterium]